MSFHSFRVHSRQIDNPAVAGRTIALQICSNCHSVNGISVSPMFPTLGGQPKEFLVNQLMDFRAHLRSDPNVRKFMWGFTHLSDEQIEQLATYYSSRSPPAGVHGDRLAIDDGRTIFISGIPDKGVPACSACHGLRGEGMGGVPRLAGQHADYIVKQLLVFRHARQSPRGEVMKAICDTRRNRRCALWRLFSRRPRFRLGYRLASGPLIRDRSAGNPITVIDDLLR
jgi:cytochrome c553